MESGTVLPIGTSASMSGHSGRPEGMGEGGGVSRENEGTVLFLIVVTTRFD
jgi:hypothetical protein